MNNEQATNQNGNNEESFTATSLGSVPPVTEPTNNVPPVDNVTSEPIVNNEPLVNPNPEPAVDSLNPNPVATPNGGVNPMPTEPVTPTPQAIDVEPVNAPGTPINPLPNNNLGPIEQPIPGTTYTATDNVNSNGFVETNKVENVGTEPPMQNEPKAKKPMNKVLFIILIVALLGGIAYGIYYYLKLGQDNKKISVTTKTVESDLNAPLSTNIADYATITGTSSTNCQLNTGEVDITKEGAYEYTVTCGNDTYKGAIRIVDNAPLTVESQEVYAVLTQEGATPREFKAEEFVQADTCSGEECTYEFVEGTDFNAYLAQVGNYDINIIVTDKNGKTNTVTAPLVVLETQVRLFVSCTLPITEPTPGTINDYIAIGQSDASGNGYIYAKYAYRLTTFNFAAKEDYEAVIGEKPSELTYNNVMGKATYDDENLTLTLKTNLTTDALNSEAGGTFPSAFGEINQYYQNKGYTCTNMPLPAPSTTN